MNKTIIIPIMLLMLSFSVLSMQLSNPTKSFYALGSDIRLDFNVYDDSRVPIDDSNVTCNIKTTFETVQPLLYDSDNTHYIIFNSTQITQVGEYPYVTECYLGSDGAFLENTIIVTKSGLYNDIVEDNKINTAFIIFFIVLCLFLIMLGLYVQNAVITMFGGIFLIIIGFHLLLIGLPMFMWLSLILLGVVLSTSYKE